MGNMGMRYEEKGGEGLAYHRLDEDGLVEDILLESLRGCGLRESVIDHLIQQLIH